MMAGLMSFCGTRRGSDWDVKRDKEVEWLHRERVASAETETRSVAALPILCARA